MQLQRPRRARAHAAAGAQKTRTRAQTRTQTSRENEREKEAACMLLAKLYRQEGRNRSMDHEQCSQGTKSQLKKGRSRREKRQGGHMHAARCQLADQLYQPAKPTEMPCKQICHITALHTPPLTLACTASVIQSSARGDRYRCCCLFLYYLYIFACLRVHCIALLHALRKETPQASWSAVSGGRSVALVWSAWLRIGVASAKSAGRNKADCC